MDYLQYLPQEGLLSFKITKSGFKPYYKWITFNTRGTLPFLNKKLLKQF